MKKRKLNTFILLSSITITPILLLTINNQNQQIMNEIKSINSSNEINICYNDVTIDLLNNPGKIDSGEVDNGEQTKNGTYKFSFNYENVFKKYFLGPFEKNKKYLKGTNFRFSSKNEKDYLLQMKYEAADPDNTGEQNFYLFNNEINNCTNKTKYIFQDNFNIKMEGNTTKTNVKIIPKKTNKNNVVDKITWTITNKLKNKNNQIIEFEIDNELYVNEKNDDGWSNAHAWINYNENKIKNYKLDFTLPYTKFDIELFKSTFQEILGKTIVLKDVKNPIIFDYVENENEKNVKRIIDERIKEFFKNQNIVNSKLGPISKFDPNLKEYIFNKDVGEIKIEIPEFHRGKSGPKKISIIYKLSNGHEFEYFDNKKEYKIDLEIRTQLGLDKDYSIDKLVSIEPYKGSSDGYNDNFLIKEYNDCRIGINNPPNEIIFKKTNINDPGYIINNANENLIPDEKFPVISKAGTILKIKLAIQLGSPKNIIEEVVEFNRIFTNGKIYQNHIIKDKKYQTSPIKINGNQLNLCLEIKDNNVYLSSDSKIELIANNGTKIETNTCFIEIKDIHISIPSEQIKSSSKWIQEISSKFLTDKNNSLIRYVGGFEIYDPFFFTLINQMIDIYDPITLKPLGAFSKYKPFIVNNAFDIENVESKGESSPIYPSASEQSTFKANLGPYIMANRPTEGGEFKFHIAIKEFDQNSKNEDINERYTKLKWVIDINMKLLDSKSTLEMLGYKNNQNINEINEQKYFNEDDIENYRGNFANRDTGMYIPKIVWVNAYPPESFLYDPKNKNGELIVPINANNNVISQAKYDIGYIAELNGTAFASGDYTSNETFGGFEIIFDENKFKPTGLIPYIEKYKFNKNSIEPKKERIALSASGYQNVDNNNDFGQIVLKRPNSNTFLYQFFKINKREEILKYRNDLISLYGNHIGLKGQPLFIDFWSTYHGNNLKEFLLDRKLIEDEQKIKELEYSDVIQYWNIYVNDPSNYNGQIITGNDINKFKPNLGYELIQKNDKRTLKENVILVITKKVNEILFKEGWINEKLEYKNDLNNNPFKIEENEDIFEKKLSLLLDEYNKNLLEAQLIDFNIVINEDYFKNKPIKIKGKNSISILNNKDIDKIIDLSNFKGSTLLINSKNSYFNQANQFQLIKEITNEIEKSLHKDWKKIMQNNALGIENYVPIKNVDYKLKFHNKWGNYYKSIEEAIKFCLLLKTDLENFNNDLFIEVEAIFDNKSHFMKNSFTKIINNNSKNVAVTEIENFDLNQVKANDLKINTNKIGVLNNQIFWKPEDDDYKKANAIWELIKNRVNYDIRIQARKWMNAYNIDLTYEKNYEIKIIKNIDEYNNVIYYEKNDDILNIIKNVLLNISNNDKEFNQSLLIDVVAIKDLNNNSYTIGSFRKTINNSNLNDGIEDDSNNEIINIDDNNSSININNKKGENNNLNMWWIITPLTIFGLLSIILIVIVVVRKNRRIR